MWNQEWKFQIRILLEIDLHPIILKQVVHVGLGKEDHGICKPLVDPHLPIGQGTMVEEGSNLAGVEF